MNNTVRPLVATLSATIIFLCLPSISYAQLDPPQSPRQSIRFYKVNKQLQADRIMLTDKKSSASGCQNFIKKVRVHRAVQLGHSYCSLYTKKDCEPSSVITADQEEEPRRTSLLTEGRGWFPVSEEELFPDPNKYKNGKPKESLGVKLASWHCSNELGMEQLAHESRLAGAEIVRLNSEAIKAADRAAIYQKRAAKAQKQLDEATELAGVMRTKALAAGATLVDPPGLLIGVELDEDGNPVVPLDGEENTNQAVELKQ